MKVIGIGGGGHARVLLDILRLTSAAEIVGFTDPDSRLHGTKLDGSPVLGGDDLLPEMLEQGVRYAFLGVGAVGDNRRRAEIYDRVRGLGFSFLTLVHPTAVIANSAAVGDGAAIMAGVIINPGTQVNANVIVNTGAIVDHDCKLGDHVHVAPGAVLSGGVEVGAYAHIGAGAVVRQGIKIGEGSLVAAGAVVVADIPNGRTAIGVPARVQYAKA